MLKKYKKIRYIGTSFIKVRNPWTNENVGKKVASGKLIVLGLLSSEPICINVHFQDVRFYLGYVIVHLLVNSEKMIQNNFSRLVYLSALSWFALAFIKLILLLSILFFLSIAFFSFISVFLTRFMHTNLLWRWQKLIGSNGFSSIFRYFNSLFCGEVLNYKIDISMMPSLGNFYPYRFFVG